MNTEKILINIKNVINHREIKRMFFNASWLTFDKIIRMGINLFVVAWIARYLGREQYGNLSFAYSFNEIVGIIGTFGTNYIIIREVVKNLEKENEILGSGFFIRLFGGILVIFFSTVTIIIIRKDDPLTQMLVVIISTVYILGPFDVISLWFQSQIKSKYCVIAASSAFILISIWRIILINIEAPLYTFAVASVFEILLTQIGLIIIYRFKGKRVLNWKWDFSIAKQLMRDSWPLMLAYASTILFMKIDQVMLGQIIDFNELGLFSAAVRISEVWYFIPVSISLTIYPKIVELRNINEKEYYMRVQQFFDLMMVIVVIITIPAYILRREIIDIIFGGEFIGASEILGIHIWSGIFVNLGTARNAWCNAENKTWQLFFATFAGAICNILLNIPFIKLYGGLGAAVSTMIARVISGYIATVFISRRVFLMQTKSFIPKALFTQIKKHFV